MENSYYLMLIFLTLTIPSISQTKHEKEGAAAIEVLKKRIVDADRNLLGINCSDVLVYGHSSGKV